MIAVLGIVGATIVILALCREGWHHRASRSCWAKMQIFHDEAQIPEPLRGAIVAIGNFDGVHRGHQALLSAARATAAAAHVPFGILTFEPHPRAFFRPERPVFRLTPPPLKKRLIAATGANFQLTLTFDRRLANLEAEDFVKSILVERLAVSRVVTGYDFHFGHGRKGSPELMNRLGRDLGFAVTIVEQVTDDEGRAPFSSSAIRDDLRHGRVGEAAASLGYWWIVSGKVVAGDGRGRSMGFATANLRLDPGVEPLEGIYAVRIALAGKLLHGAAYIGTRPTFETERRFLEIHIFDFDRNIYGETLDVQFLALIRPDMKFASPEALIARMKTDCEEAACRLEAIAANDPMRHFPIGRLQAEGKL